MPPAAGTRLGPYEIQSAFGSGGMGEVYKARDVRLDRSVTIKVLPQLFAAAPQRVSGSLTRVGIPRALFEVILRPAVAGNAYEVVRDGERFPALRRLPAPPPSRVAHISLITNWFEELEANLPTHK